MSCTILQIILKTRKYQIYYIHQHTTHTFIIHDTTHTLYIHAHTTCIHDDGTYHTHITHALNYFRDLSTLVVGTVALMGRFLPLFNRFVMTVL